MLPKRVHASPPGIRPTMASTVGKMQAEFAGRWPAPAVAEKTWELFEGNTKWILPDSDQNLKHKLGAEVKSAPDVTRKHEEIKNFDKKMPVASDYQFFRKTELLKSISRDFEEISEAYPDLRSFLTDLMTRWFETRTITAERLIGKYLITDIIGSGGYSIVYRGVHEALNMPVAIKMMKHDLAMNADFIQNFRVEARTVAKFNHENIVHVYDIEERYKTIFIIMEQLEGMSMRILLKRMLRLSVGNLINMKAGK